jgi:hypothetical protein
MFKRVLLEEWTLYLPFVAFFLFAAIFALIVCCALRLRGSSSDRLAALPFDDSDPSPSTPETDN